MLFNPYPMSYTDKVTLERIQLLHPKVRNEAQEIYKEICNRLTRKSHCRFSSTLRTFKEQQAIYDQGRTKPGKIVSNARPGTSFHNYGLAIDIVLLIDKDDDGYYETASWDTAGDYDKDGKADWLEVVQVFKEFGWVWGGDFRSFRDFPHFEKSFGYSVRQLLDLHNAGKVDEQGYVLI